MGSRVVGTTVRTISCPDQPRTLGSCRPWSCGSPAHCGKTAEYTVALVPRQTAACRAEPASGSGLDSSFCSSLLQTVCSGWSRQIYQTEILAAQRPPKVGHQWRYFSVSTAHAIVEIYLEMLLHHCSSEIQVRLGLLYFVLLPQTQASLNLSEPRFPHL